MATLNARLLALEAAASDDTDQGTGFDFAPVMTPEAWDIAAREQQAELLKGWHDECTNPPP